MLPSTVRTASAPGTILLSRLNGWPMRSPVNASPKPSRAPAHDSGPMRLATPSSWGTCTPYSLPVSRRTRTKECNEEGRKRKEEDGRNEKGSSPFSRRYPLGIARRQIYQRNAVAQALPNRNFCRANPRRQRGLEHEVPPVSGQIIYQVQHVPAGSEINRCRRTGQCCQCHVTGDFVCVDEYESVLRGRQILVGKLVFPAPFGPAIMMTCFIRRPIFCTTPSSPPPPPAHATPAAASSQPRSARP